jgi:Rps23 Pro-64 3,4-dihydroxylase Tpa1-like proline 4-hydroxylase
MTPKQILDSFSETLMRDERILSAPERALLTTLLQHARAASAESHETQEAVRAVIASAVGDTVAQRAFAVLGGSIVERILESRPLAQDPTPPSPGPQSPGVREPHKAPHSPMRDSPTPPSPGPQSPGVREPHKPPHSPMRDTPTTPAPGPQSPGHDSDKTTVVSHMSVAVVERPPALKAECVVLDEFLSPQEVEELVHFTLAHESDFRASEVVSPREERGVVSYEHRRSRVLVDLEHHQDVMLERIKSILPQVLQKLRMEPFTIAGVEAQVTASNDGDFFCFHSDNDSEHVASRYLTFVYFFHREPPQFEGGELRLHNARLEDGGYVSEGNYQTIVPQQNQIVFFPCELMHEITPVRCPSRLFADSRFTLNGWLRR